MAGAVRPPLRGGDQRLPAAGTKSGKGLVQPLYEALLDCVRAAGMHVAIAGITQPNPASARFHERLGFMQVAMFKEVGFKFDRWLDVGYWELRFDQLGGALHLP